ncbi:MAG: response regulator transcription factor [Candidatus Moduliflexus flocculans]|nr:response regulator transcription factor [Candidatus Moduliflexus flocculans]
MGVVLLIEDDEALGRQVVDQLEAAGFSAIWWRRGRIIDASDYRDIVLVILDLMLPGVAGLDILKQLRKDSEVPVLVLSARQDSNDKVRALKLGADDYVTKPFWPEELIERVRARLRRFVMDRSSQVKLGGLLIDGAKREVTVDGERLELTRVELDLLLALAHRVGEPVSRRWLLANVLDPEKEATERTLDVHISRLRKKLGDTTVIETVWGIGYRLRKEAE